MQKATFVKKGSEPVRPWLVNGGSARALGHVMVRGCHAEAGAFMENFERTEETGGRPLNS